MIDCHIQGTIKIYLKFNMLRILCLKYDNNIYEYFKELDDTVGEMANATGFLR